MQIGVDLDLQPGVHMIEGFSHLLHCVLQGAPIRGNASGRLGMIRSKPGPGDFCRPSIGALRYRIKGHGKGVPPRHLMNHGRLRSIILRASFREERTRESRWAYRNKVNACCGSAFAWARMAMPDCTRIWFLVNTEVSYATSASRMRDSAAEKFWLVT